jgi:hypothetical protein
VAEELPDAKIPLRLITRVYVPGSSESGLPRTRLTGLRDPLRSSRSRRLLLGASRRGQGGRVRAADPPEMPLAIVAFEPHRPLRRVAA